jgi:hypothetical protein
MYRICSASGTTTIANENIIEAIKDLTLLKDIPSSLSPFVLRKVNIFLSSNSNIYFNTQYSDIALGLNKTFVKESFPGSGEYIVATNLSEVIISKIVIETTGTQWEITFLY